MDHHLKNGDSTIGSFLHELKDRKNASVDDWLPSEEPNKMICDVINSSDVTIKQVKKSEDLYNEHKKILEPTKWILDALTAVKIEPKILPKKGKNEFIHQLGSYSPTESKALTNARKNVSELSKRHHFFHWEIEMMDAFTDSRHGFDLIVGNPPWDKVKGTDKEFFMQYHEGFKKITTKPKREKIKKKILEDTNILKEYEKYKNNYREKSMLYSSYNLQSTGDKDLWKLVLERSLSMISKNGVISMILPTQILSNVGTVDLRKDIFAKNILSLYVFENRKKIFPIDSRIRFALLTVRNDKETETFPVGFYLHYPESLIDNTKEKEKFGTLTKSQIKNLSSTEYYIPEMVGNEFKAILKLSKNNSLKNGLGKNWDVNLSSGFHRTEDSNLFLNNGNGWPIHEGKTLHQYNHRWARSEFSADKRKGLKRESKKRIFEEMYVEFYNSFKLCVRNITVSTNMRTAVSTIIPPNEFYTNSLISFILKYNGKIRLDYDYNKKISYVCGILNSLAFDFLTRANILASLAPILQLLPFPKLIHEQRISELAAKMVVGTPEFEGFADSLRVPNVQLTPAQRIETAAEIDALVAHSYDLTLDEYSTIIDSFPAFKKNPALYELDDIKWDNQNLKEFYGEMAELALAYYEEIVK